MENNEVEQDELYEEQSYDFITEEALEYIHLDLDQTLPYQTMNSDIV